MSAKRECVCALSVFCFVFFLETGKELNWFGFRKKQQNLIDIEKKRSFLTFSLPPPPFFQIKNQK